MSTTIFQNRGSPCFESLLSETTTSTTTLKLKLAAAPPSDIDRPTNLKFGNLDFPQTVYKETEDSYYTERDNYTSCPWAKKSSFPILSARSLELCTENLGSETGSEILTDGDAAVIFSSTNSSDCSAPKQRKLNSEKKPNHSFPPPLTTMCGARSLQVQRHREGGRLIIEAVEAPFSNCYMQAERSDGRLRLSFLTAEATCADEEEDDGEWDGELAAEEVEKQEEKFEEVANEVELDYPKEEIEHEDEINNNNNLEMEIEMEKYQWLSRCKEEGGHANKGVCGNWKPAFWVAIT
ncbi:hypothetical protein CASFOL_029790 [Castilleja foliolosa]|uniref:FAF domain-containing protein n=1 Tax=Castilleja foliolosa TaxID=1961234 RepID=A0ABD3C8X5_9LAMI